MRRMTSDFREPVIWLVLAIVARGIAEIVAFVLLDQDLIRHEQAEAGAEHELSVIYGRLGQQVPSPDQGRVKRPDNYVGRIVAAIFSLGIYMFWWFYNQMEEPNKHFAGNWAQEDELVKAVDASAEESPAPMTRAGPSGRRPARTGPPVPAPGIRRPGRTETTPARSAA